MKTPNPAHVERLIAVINNAPFFRLLSMRMQDIGVGYSTTEIGLADKHLNPCGAIHGGVFSSIVDSAASWALYYGIEDEHAGLTTVDLKVNFLAPSISGKVIAKGHQIKLGRTIGYADCEVRGETGKLLGHGTLTALIIPGKIPVADPPFPAKFSD